MDRRKNTSIDRHPGLAILEAIMCFELVVSHLWEVNVTQTGVGGWIYYLKDYSFPVFMVLAFFVSAKTLESLNWDKIGDHILGIAVPLVGWGVIYWIFYLLLKETLSPGYNLGVKDLFYQIVTGNSQYLNNVMWYQVNLLILTILFAVIILISSKLHSAVLSLIMLVAIVCQYSAMTSFISGWRTEVAGMVGRLPEMLPLAVTGYLLAYFATLEKTRKYWPVAIIFGVIITCFFRYNIVFTEVNGFGFAGLRKIAVAASLVALFYAAPLEKLPNFVKLAIEWITNYTLGIFCMHKLVSALLHYFISHRGWISMETYTMFDCVLTYIICYIISFLIARIPCRWTKMLVE